MKKLLLVCSLLFVGAYADAAARRGHKKSKGTEVTRSWRYTQRVPDAEVSALLGILQSGARDKSGLIPLYLPSYHDLSLTVNGGKHTVRADTGFTELHGNIVEELKAREYMLSVAPGATTKGRRK